MGYFEALQKLTQETPIVQQLNDWLGQGICQYDKTGQHGWVWAWTERAQVSTDVKNYGFYGDRPEITAARKLGYLAQYQKLSEWDGQINGTK